MSQFSSRNLPGTRQPENDGSRHTRERRSHESLCDVPRPDLHCGVSRSARTGLRAAIRGAPDLLVRAACNAGALTKTQLMGWFALTSLEADALPRSQYMRLRGPGFYFLYRAAAFDQALYGCLGSAKEWEARLRARGSAAATELDVKMSPQKRGCEWHTPPRYHCLARCR